MVNAVKNLTRMSTDVRKLAKLLQAKAPPGHKLAFINDDEAALLKRRGGSGRITEAGIPSYEDTFYSDPTSEQGLQPVDTTPAPTPVTAPETISNTYYSEPTSQQGQQSVTQPSAQPDLTPLEPQQVSAPQIPTVDVGLAGEGSPADLSPLQAQTVPSSVVPTVEATTPPAPTPEPTAPAAPKAPTDKGISDKTLAALGLGGAQALIGAQQIRKAQAGAGAAPAALSALGVPQQQLGAQEMAQAQRGELTAGNQAAVQAARAQLQQGIANRGGVGVQQSANQIASLTNQLLQQQYQQGSADLAAGNKYAASAIQLGVQQDQYIQSMTANYVANLARTVASLYGSVPQTVATTPPSP
jgi:hypothetical protein